jgi:hypothetical protein
MPDPIHSLREAENVEQLPRSEAVPSMVRLAETILRPGVARAAEAQFAGHVLLLAQWLTAAEEREQALREAFERCLAFLERSWGDEQVEREEYHVARDDARNALQVSSPKASGEGTLLAPSPSGHKRFGEGA